MSVAALSLSLSASRLFDSIEPADRALILALGVRRSLRRGQVLLRQGEAATTLYLIGRGYLKLTQLTADGSEVIIRFAGPGEPVGGVAALGEAPYPITGTASEPVDVVGWARTVVVDVLARHPQMRTNIMREMSSHMGDAMTRVREMATERVGQRLAHTLLRLAQHCGRKTESAIEIPHSLTRQELASLTGTTLFTVSRTLSEWEDAGWVRSTRAHVELLDLPALRRLAETSEDTAHTPRPATRPPSRD